MEFTSANHVTKTYTCITSTWPALYMQLYVHTYMHAHVDDIFIWHDRIMVQGWSRVSCQMQVVVVKVFQSRKGFCYALK